MPRSIPICASALDIANAGKRCKIPCFNLAINQSLMYPDAPSHVVACGVCSQPGAIATAHCWYDFLTGGCVAGAMIGTGVGTGPKSSGNVYGKPISR